MPALILALVAYVPLLLCLLPFSPKPSRATHTICSWQIGKEVPSRYKFDLFCPANIYDNTSDYAQYRCPDHWQPKGGVQVADWGKLALEILEWGTPCAGGGYGRDSENRCYGSHWALCLGDQTKGDCLYMSSADDCQWPKLFSLAERPLVVSVWYRKYGVGEEELVEGEGVGML